MNLSTGIEDTWRYLLTLERYGGDPRDYYDDDDGAEWSVRLVHYDDRGQLSWSDDAAIGGKTPIEVTQQLAQMLDSAMRAPIYLDLTADPPALIERDPLAP